MKRKKRRRGIWAAAAGMGFLLLLAAVFVQPAAHIGAEQGNRKIQKISIGELIEKGELSKEDYQKIFCQTGLGQAAVDRIRRGRGFNKEEFFAFQERFLHEAEPECKASNLFTKQDLLRESEKGKLVPLEDGDVLISFSSHSLGWHHGHAGIVIDAEKKLCLEAVCPGSPSRVRKSDHWENYSGFLVLRLADTAPSQRKAVAAYAGKKLTDVPYSLTGGLLHRDDAGAQCADLIWRAYRHFGYNVDSDGGRLVTVKDLAESQSFDIVQVFGMNPEQVWRNVNDND